MGATEISRPYVVEHLSWVGTCLRIRDVDATVPEALLPARVRLAAAWRHHGGTTWRQWYADHDGGLISFPDAPGDGGPALEQLLDWLGRHGYEVAPGTADDDPDPTYVRGPARTR